ncbi:MAG: hypothetical protein JXB25_12420 [Deltaproteobacteria bacterium]|nr:hypothetical protein [Deltaproteobacteria bacterium]
MCLGGFHPGIPFSLNEKGIVITRTIVPLVDQNDFPLEAMNELGLGDITASQFFSPKASISRGWGRSNCRRQPPKMCLALESGGLDRRLWR